VGEPPSRLRQCQLRLRLATSLTSWNPQRHVSL
jgi:hypothetical protein